MLAIKWVNLSVTKLLVIYNATYMYIYNSCHYVFPYCCTMRYNSAAYHSLINADPDIIYNSVLTINISQNVPWAICKIIN